MSRLRRAGSEAPDSDGIDISPLIDVVFILLIFFIVTTVFVEEPGVEVDRPRATTEERLKKHSILIAITEGGEVVYGGKSIGVSGVQPLVKRVLRKEQLPVIVQADETARSSTLVQVIGEAKRAGAEVVSIATRGAPGRGGA